MTIVGIDFGSTRTRASFYHKGKYHFLEPIPSYVGFQEETGKLITGYKAQANYLRGDKKVVYNLKSAVLKDQRYKLGPSSFLAISLISEILSQIIARVEDDTGEPVSGAIMTVPSFFSEIHKGALKDAALLSGLRVVKVISEPTAAAIYYTSNDPESKDFKNDDSKNILLIDSGGLTTDATLCKISPKKMKIQAVYGDNGCGCSLVDQGLVELMKSKLALIDFKGDLQERWLTANAEAIKLSIKPGKGLSYTMKENIDSEKSYKIEFIWEELVEVHKAYLSRIKEVYRALVGSTKISIQSVLLVGGPFQSEYIKNEISNFIKEPIVDFKDFGYTVAKGAALYGHQLVSGNSERILQDIVPLAIGVEVNDGIMSPIIPANTPYPHTFSKIFTTTEDYQKSIKVKIYQGNRLLTRDCTYLGELSLHDLPPLERGAPQIKVGLNTDEDGLLRCFVEDEKTGIRKQLKLSAKNRLTQMERTILSRGLQDYRSKNPQLELHLNLVNHSKYWLNLAEDRISSNQDSKILKASKEELEKVLETYPLNYSLLEEVLQKTIINYEALGPDKSLGAIDAR